MSVRRRGRRIRVDLGVEEVALVLALSAQTLELLSDGDPAPTEADLLAEDPDELEQMLDAPTGPVETPRDPALLRLLPDGYRDDDDAAGEFRRLTESGLRATKRTALQQLVDDLCAAVAETSDGDVRIDLEEAAAEAWLPAITDLRLVFGTRIGVTEEMDDERGTVVEGSAREAEIAAYDWLTWWQQAMVEALIDG